MSEIAIQDGVLATTLDGDIDDSVTSLDVAAGTGSDYPTAPFPIQCGSENLMVTVVATDTFTVERGLGDTIEAAHTDGDTIIHVVTADSFPTRKDDTSGAYVMQDDLDLDGNELIGYTPPAQQLVGLADVDVTSGAIGDSLIFQGSTYTEIVRTLWTAYSDGGNNPAYAIDASTSSYYKSRQLSASVNKSLRIDLGAEEDISRITIIQTNGSRDTTGVNVDVATTGAGISDDWTTVQYFSGLIVGTNNLDLTVPKSARYVRLNPIDNGYSSQWELMDVKAYSSVAVWENEETAFREGTAKFDAQGDIDLDGNDLLGAPMQTVSETEPTSPNEGDIWVNPSAPASSPSGGAELRLTSVQSIPDVTFTAVEWDAQEYDDADFWEGVTNPERITFPEAGRYHVIVNYHFDGTATGLRGARLIRNGDATAELVEDFHKATDLVVYRGNFACVVNAAAGDYVSVQVYHSNGSALDLKGASGDDIETTRLWVYQL